MTKTKKIIYSVLAVVLVFVLIFIGILIGQHNSYGSYNDYDSYDSYNTKSVNAEYAGEDYGDTFAVEEAANGDSSGSLFARSEEKQKLVYTGDVTIGTENINKSYKKITEKMQEFGATFESVNESASYKTMVIRVPKDKFMDMYESLSEVDGSITYSNVSISDMTKVYTDNERRLDILKTEYDELKDLMKDANKVDDILAIRDRLTDLTYEIESLKGSNDTIDYDANFSRLEVTLHLTGSASPVSFWYQIKEAFSNSIQAIKALFLFIIELWWVILAGLGIFFFVRKKVSQSKDEPKIEESKVEDIVKEVLEEEKEELKEE